MYVYMYTSGMRAQDRAQRIKNKSFWMDLGVGWLLDLRGSKWI